MKKGYIKLLSICFIMMMLISTNSMFKILDKYTYILFLLVAFIATIFIIGYEKDEFIYKKDLMIISGIIPVFWLVITYGIGLLLGFLSTSYELNFLNVLKNILVVSITIILEELIRYNIIKKGSRNKSMLFIVTILFILMNTTLILRGFDLSNNAELVKFICSYCLPITVNNIFLTYLSYKAGFKPCILYLFVTSLYLYFMPIFPSLGIYMDSILKILLAITMIIFTYILTKRQERDIESNLKVSKFISILFIILILLTIGINSHWFKYYSLTVGSGSMKPNLDIGDVVIVEKLEPEEIKKLQIDEILVYKNHGKTIIHRINNIKNDNGELVFYTKGDANDGIDRYVTREKDIIGRTKLKIPLIGIPSIRLNEFINKE